MDGLLILAIETATSCGSVSLSIGTGENFRLLTECIAEPDITHSRRLLGSVSWAMEAAGKKWDAVDAIAVSLGPGSFTGLRIGLAAAKAMAMATGKPLVGVPTLDALALSCCGINEGRQVAVVLDARKKEVYAGFFRIEGGMRPVPAGGPMVIGPEELRRRIQEPTILAGPGVAAYQEIFQEHELIEMLPGYLSSPRAAYVGLLAGRMLAEGGMSDPAAVSPIYVRASEAELSLRKKGEAK